MKKNKIKIFIAIFIIIVTLFTVCGCAVAEVNISSDGSGAATIIITKEDGITLSSIEDKIENILNGVEALSGDKDRLTLSSIEEFDNNFAVKFKFKRIQNTKGIGDYNFMSSSDFLKELNKVSLITNKWANGKYGTVQMYNQSIYEFNDRISELEILPIYTNSNQTLTAEEFVSQDGILSKNSKGIIFTYFIAGIEGIESITFNFDGKIEVYGGKNVEIIDENSIKITPTTATSTILTSDAEYIIQETDCFVGYVYYISNSNWLLIGSIILIAILIIGLIILGILNGFFKRVFASKKFNLIIKNYDLYLMLIPAMVLIIVFSYLPMTGIVLAFKNYSIDDGIWGSEWAGNFGFKNFIDILTEPGTSYWLLVKNTIILASLKFVCGFTFAITLSILFSYLKNGMFKKSVQTISYFPYFISWVVISGISYLFLAADGGILNKIVAAFGGDSIKWYSEPKYWRTILTFTAIWKTVGYSTIIYLAAMTAINISLYEAATIDGCSRFEQLIYITIPGMYPVIGIQLIFSLGNLIKDDFDQIYTMTGGSSAYLRDTTEVISTVVYKAISGGANGYGSATAMSLLQSLVSLLLVIGANRLVKKLNMDGAF
jgi:putative aldouronate transport system permease protein